LADTKQKTGIVKTLLPLIHDLVAEVPPGQVASYGQIAFVVSAPSARIVGRAMATLPGGSPVPWHRIVNSVGRLAKRKEGGESPEQRRRLREEGVTLDVLGRIALKDHAWPGPSWHWLEAQGIDVEELVIKSGPLKRRGIWANWRF
jgi:methylated-DNA-protein-cysteine methyltransferase-like protein